MLLKITKHLIQPFARSQNFFEMNPVFPDMGQKDFDLYNVERKKINVVDAYEKVQNRQKQVRDMVRKKIYLHKYKQYRNFKKAKRLTFDEETKLPIGLDIDLDQFIIEYKANKLVTKNAKSQFKKALLNLVHKFNCKSESQLIRLFRISIANSKKKTLIDKMRGKIMQESLMRTSAVRRNVSPRDGQNVISQMEEEEFEKILKEIDEKIQKAELSLKFDQYGIPKKISKYDPQYGWEQIRNQEFNDEYDYTSQIGKFGEITKNAYNSKKNLQDESIRSRINRFYFLRRLELLKQQKDEHVGFFQELPMNLKQRENIMNQIAHKYKQDQLIQEPFLQFIYRQFYFLIYNIYIKVRPVNQKRLQNQKAEELFDKSPSNSSYLWDNLDVDQILCSDLYSYENIKSTKLNQRYAKSVSPNPDLQVSLSSLPMNLYRHSEFEMFGIFNQYRRDAGEKFLGAQETDYEPQFQNFGIQEAEKHYQKLQKKVKEGQQTSQGKAKRKKSVSQVFITKGTGYVTINGKPIQDYFGDVYYRVQTLKPLVFTDTSGLYDLKFNVVGGGSHGQSQCMAYALARALIKINPQHKTILAQFGLDGYDYRQKEAKKTNLYSARKRPPFVRR